ncbi:MAG: 1-deoxy-D-xylulose-5-phosphate synthase [Owenweeksia sp.]
MSTILDSVHKPEDIRRLEPFELPGLAEELRSFMLKTTKTKAGHIQSSLGVVELTIALHYSYNTPEDVLIWDVGHQAYVHKLLTGRKEVFASNRKKGGLSGFTKRSESEYDPFGAGHSSTSISAAVGFAEADRLLKRERQYIAVLGDGALTGGESFEALNYLGERQLNVTVVLNDNESSIDSNVGALAHYGNYEALCKAFQIDYYCGIDGHNVESLINTFSEVRGNPRPKMIKVDTQKGKGWSPQSSPVIKNAQNSFQDIFAETLIELARSDERVVAVTPAMLSGSGLDLFQREFPDRTFDVGIAEQHAVTFSAAMSANGLKPFCHLYSTFSQRAYDQIIHDVALQNLPVVFCLDRAGLVGEDGPTHHGSFDPGFLNTIPNLIIAAPMDGISLKGTMHTALASNSPFVIRFPKGGSFEEKLPLPPIPIGQLRKLKAGKEKAVISFGAIGLEVMKALESTSYAHYDLLYLKPIDSQKIKEIFIDFEEVIVVEENSAAGAAGETINGLKNAWAYSSRLKCRVLPDSFVEHASRQELLEITGLDHKSLRRFIDS